MDLAAERAEQALDRGMDVLVRVTDLALRRDLVEPRLHVAQLRLGEQARRVQAAGVLGRGGAVVREQLAVVGAQEGPHLLRERLLHACRPDGHAGWRRASRDAASSVSRPARVMKPDAASCGKVSPVAYEARVSA